jgi:hypothetical protein
VLNVIKTLSLKEENKNLTPIIFGTILLLLKKLRVPLTLTHLGKFSKLNYDFVYFIIAVFIV